ncbi:uncharacterized protein Eint_040410 [Encephalitozoon intestinalis ATCC 50506]|uniref:Uncharacterized protein n=1 Tax=Encephalitozoon intestinalis (strain ATCC 50506) TaxID=876142 RepID=E0S6J6_ENCIT|nr:uncharacterized protein Eint_040410 [Encephalitozoon intestinalis ATCC 50506]ADM11331.1 hypothetical protein Eint_040410 [Encephalitozoon intestinalis ATCC 50506]UTX45018.1 hypothetical protein GPK93_04g05540 [Encephalitozoon intestinalis]
MEGIKLFAEVPNVSFRLIRGISDCKEFVVYDGNVFCLTNRSTLIALSSGEEYTFYGDILKMGIYEHYIYLVFKTSKIIVFDAISREVVVNLPEMRRGVKKVIMGRTRMHFLGGDGVLYGSAFEDIKYFKNQSICREKDGYSIIQDFWVSGDSIFHATPLGHVYKDSSLVLKVFDTVKLLVPREGYLYIVTSGDLLLKYDTCRAKILFKKDIGSSRVVGDNLIAFGGMVTDLFGEVSVEVPRDASWVVRGEKSLYVLTPSGVFFGDLSD